MQPSRNILLVLHAMLGSALGFFWSVIFLLMYYGQQFDIPVTDGVRMRSAFWMATIIIAAIVLIFYRGPIIARLQGALETYEDDRNAYIDEDDE